MKLPLPPELYSAIVRVVRTGSVLLLLWAANVRRKVLMSRRAKARRHLKDRSRKGRSKSVWAIRSRR